MANVGSLDRAFRIVLGLVLIALMVVPATAQSLASLGGWAWLIPAVGIVLVVTGLVRFCPAYRLLGLRTCPR
jgi:hypothetical protein